MNVQALIAKAAKTLKQNSATILTGIGIIGFGTTVVMVAKAAPSAKDIHDRESEIRDDLRDEGDDEGIKESCIYEAKKLLSLYGPPIGVGVMSVACFIGANKIHMDRQTALLAAYSLSEKTLTTYQAKVIEKLGDETHSDILNEATKEIVRSNAPEGDEHITPVVPAGLVRCYDNVTGRYFFSSETKIMEAESTINKKLLTETRVPLQEFYYELGINDRFALGDAAGWDISLAYATPMLDVYFTPMLDDDKNPVLALNYHITIFDRQA